MGKSRHQRKKYSKPNHPWQSERIEEEKKISDEYGFTNKRQIWKMKSLVRNFRAQARTVVGLRGDKKDTATATLINSLTRIGLVKKDATTDDVLNLNVRDLLERRLQTVVYKMGLSNSIKQARQFIIHRKITVNSRVVSSPSYIIKKNDKVAARPGFKPQLVEVVTKKKPEEEAPTKIQEVPANG
jgi:small subunit ribosomal protein S4|tara:strand:- start:1831 stop:2385 length:555 start_codon:yes stop_codon:yes gene_type:complete